MSAQPVTANDNSIRASVQTYYGEVLKGSDDLKTNACCTASAPPKEVREILKRVPDEIKAKYYGCGSPFPLGISGLRVLDLGCGTGRDCYVCAAMVGEGGFVTGVDMTPAQLEVAERHLQPYTQQLGYSKPNMRFVSGHIEDLASAGIADNSVDIVISNCVVNLSPNKEKVLEEVYRVLAPGGEMYFSDVYCDRRLPKELMQHEELLGECLAGALYINDFLRICRKVGFTDPRRVSVSGIEVKDPQLAALTGEATFYSITYRLFKIPDRLEDLCEDYGQVAIYKGTLPAYPHGYDLDDHHHLTKGKPMLVCGNTASMLSETWLAPHFTVTGNRSVHFGVFPCDPIPSTSSAAAGCAPGGACC